MKITVTAAHVARAEQHARDGWSPVYRGAIALAVMDQLGGEWAVVPGERSCWLVSSDGPVRRYDFPVGSRVGRNILAATAGSAVNAPAVPFEFEIPGETRFDFSSWPAAFPTASAPLVHG